MFDYTVLKIDETCGAEERLAYWEGVKLLVDEKIKESASIRDAYMTPQKLAENRETYRQEFIRMLGWPLTELTERKLPAVRKTLVEKRNFLTIYRLRLETFPGLWFEGLIFEPVHRSKKVPLVFLNPGASYCVEDLIAHGDYDCGQYKNIGGKFVEEGAIVYAPQFLLWGDLATNYEQPASRQIIDAKLRAVDGSIAALEIYNTILALDYFVAKEPVDPEKIGIAGLSFGGFYSLYIAAVEQRFKAVFSSCFFCDRFVDAPGGCRTDWLWQNSGHTFFDAEIAALVAPRALYIENGTTDALFPLESVYKEQERLKPFFKAAGAADRLMFYIGERGHEVTGNKEGIKFFLKNLLEE